MTRTASTSRRIAERSVQTTVDGTRADFAEVIQPEARSREVAHRRPAQAVPATGRRSATTQTRRLRIADDKVIEHWTNRDDIGTAAQLGWSPPSPRYLLRMALATRRARRAAAR